jgi:hypothetical protein
MQGQILSPGTPQHAISLFGLHGLGLLFPEKEADYRSMARQRPLPTFAGIRLETTRE